MTVRRSLMELTGEGILYRQQGKGTFVAGPKIIQHLAIITSFTQDMLARGMKPSSRVLEKGFLNAPKGLADKLKTAIGEPVIFIDRVRLADSKPMAIETAYVVYRLCPTLIDDDLEGNSLNALIESKYGQKFAYAIQTLEAALASGRDAQLLTIAEGDPVLRMERIYHSMDGTPIMFVVSTYRADKYKFTVTLEGMPPR
ncbi:MAG: GntR family transcriptional regulator [Firmicutes bacterium]|nr:GntR family transcriptional regulator [Bacillota bacterium]